jgi:hypothetical protein
MVVADVVLAVLTSLGLAVAVAGFVQRRNAGASCPVAASAVIAFATFGCPGCPIPLARQPRRDHLRQHTLLILLGSLYWQTSPSRLMSAGHVLAIV